MPVQLRPDPNIPCRMAIGGPLPSSTVSKVIVMVLQNKFPGVRGPVVECRVIKLSTFYVY